MHGPALISPAEEAEEATLAALLRCCVREVAGPRGLVWPAPPYLLLRVGGALLRARTRGGAALRFEGRPERLEAGAWQPLTTDELVRLAQADLGRAACHNEEFAGQVAASRTAMAVILRARAAAVPPADPWLASEQALVYGHPFHPSPKARGGRGWLRYAPEAHASFPLRLLGVRADVLAEEGEVTALDALGEAPAGYRLLPAHPWQLDLLRPALGRELVDLGPGPAVMPTSSVRTVYAPEAGVCLKFSLDVRITNCVRKNAWYELAGAVELTRRLTPIFDDISRKHPGTRWLPEPGYRSAALGPRLLEGLGVIVRTGPWTGGSPGVTPILAGALAAGSPGPQALRRDPLAWWAAYVSAVVRPVLELYFTHGVILEPHLQNVLVGLDATGLPVEAVFRDLEGAKLVTGRHDLTGLAPQVAQAVSYDAERGWARVVYCLLVNHLVEIAATVAGTVADTVAGRSGPSRPSRSSRSSGFGRSSGSSGSGGFGRSSGSSGPGGSSEEEVLSELWKAAREILVQQAGELGWPLPLSDLLAGSPLPAKANLSVRWARATDRSAGYVPIANPLA